MRKRDILTFIQEFYDNIAKMATLIIYSSAAMLFVAGFLVAYASVPLPYALATILIPTALAVIVALTVAYESTKRGWTT